MSADRFRIAYLIRVPHQSFLDTAARDPRLEIVRMTLDDGEEAALKVLETCQGYYVKASRDELPQSAVTIIRQPRATARSTWTGWKS